MKIESNGEEKISVTLSSVDMSDLEITYDEMDYANIETRRVIWTVLDEAKKVLGKPISIDSRLLIQASPAEDGGCILQFTRLPESGESKKKRFVLKKDAEPLLFCPFDINAFIDAFSLLKKTEENIKSYEAYLYNNEYFIIIQPKLSLSEKILFSFSELGYISPLLKKEISRVYEYGKKITLP